MNLETFNELKVAIEAKNFSSVVDILKKNLQEINPESKIKI